MSRLRCHISISLDGFVAGPNQSEENPLGEGGERLHDWVVRLAEWRQAHGKQGGEVNESARVVEETARLAGGLMASTFLPCGCAVDLPGTGSGASLTTAWRAEEPPRGRAFATVVRAVGGGCLSHPRRVRQSSTRSSWRT